MSQTVIMFLSPPASHFNCGSVNQTCTEHKQRTPSCRGKSISLPPGLHENTSSPLSRGNSFRVKLPPSLLFSFTSSNDRRSDLSAQWYSKNLIPIGPLFLTRYLLFLCDLPFSFRSALHARIASSSRFLHVLKPTRADPTSAEEGLWSSGCSAYGWVAEFISGGKLQGSPTWWLIKPTCSNPALLATELTPRSNSCVCFSDDLGYYLQLSPQTTSPWIAFTLIGMKKDTPRTTWAQW